jgi:hypothetical protein
VPIAQARQCKCPEIDSSQQVFAKAVLFDGVEQITVGAGDQLKVAMRFAV